MTQRQSNNQWNDGISAHPAPNNSECKTSVGKVLVSIFCDQEGILLIDYLPKGKTFNEEYYSSLVMQLMDILWEKTLGKFKIVVLFLHDNAPAHRALVTQKKLAYLGFQCLDHPPYSPDLAPSPYHLLPGVKKKLKGRHFSSYAEVIVPGRPGWACKLLNFLRSWQKLQQRTKKCSKHRGEYVE